MVAQQGGPGYMIPRLFYEIYQTQRQVEADKIGITMSQAAHQNREAWGETIAQPVLEAAEDSTEHVVHGVGDLGLNYDFVIYSL